MDEIKPININSIIQTVFKFRYWIIALMFGHTLIAAFYAYSQPKSYESVAVIRFKEKTNQASTAMEFLKSASVIGPVMEEIKFSGKQEEFVKMHVRVSHPKNTDIIQITGIGETPENAKQISESLISSLSNRWRIGSGMQETYFYIPLQDKYLAEKTLQQAQKYLETYRRNTVQVVPAAVETLAAYIANLDEYIATTRGNLDFCGIVLLNTTQQLREANISYDNSRIVDNNAVNEAIAQIAAKELELNTRFKKNGGQDSEYSLRAQEIEELKTRLDNDIRQAVKDDIEKHGLKASHRDMIVYKTVSEVKENYYKFLLDLIEKQELAWEQDVARLPEYAAFIGYYRQWRNADAEYKSINARYTKARNEQFMAAIGFQVVSPASSPSLPSGSPLRLVILGFIAGLLLSMAFVGVAAYFPRLPLMVKKGAI